MQVDQVKEDKLKAEFAGDTSLKHLNISRIDLIKRFGYMKSELLRDATDIKQFKADIAIIEKVRSSLKQSLSWCVQQHKKRKFKLEKEIANIAKISSQSEKVKQPKKQDESG